MLDPLWPWIRPLLFRFSAEQAHAMTLDLLATAPNTWARLARLSDTAPSPALARTVCGLPFAGPIGLAAGLDKDGVAIPFWPSLGFGFVEVGTVTAHPQPGNPKPRLFRLEQDGALINRMGFNNGGSEALADRLRKLRDRGAWPSVPVGANIGKSKVTPLEDAALDYGLSTKRLAGLVDWFTINVSSPNTPGLRSLQDSEALGRIIGSVLERANGTPTLLKLAPDLEPEALAEAVDFAISSGISGIVATNTTLSRRGLRVDPGEPGGLSGRPLWGLARDRIGVALQAAAGRVPVIGCGGVYRSDQARELLDMGCSAVQIYTGLIFEGPGLPSRLHRELTSDA